jgi:OTU domain-containing protein 6
MAARARAAQSLLDELSSDDDAPAPPKPAAAPKADERPPALAPAAAPVVESLAAGIAAVQVEAKEEEEEPAPGGFKMTFGKKSKKQLQKEKKEAEARRRYEETKDSMKDWDDPKVAEDERLAMQLAPLSLKIKDIQPDGHCLYRALADQCIQNLPDLEPELAKQVSSWEPGAGHTQMRKICASFMKQHADDFVPFVDTDDFGAYIDKIENTAEWGGDVELTALARRSHVSWLPRPPLVLTAMHP